MDTNIERRGRKRRKQAHEGFRVASKSTLTDVSGVVGGAKDKLRCPVVTRANVRNVGLSCNKDLGAIGSKVTRSMNNISSWIPTSIYSMGLENKKKRLPCSMYLPKSQSFKMPVTGFKSKL